MNTTIDSRKIYGSFIDPNINNCSSCDFDTYWELPEEYGEGYHGALKIRPGLILRIGDYKIYDKAPISYEVEHDYMDFEYAITGLAHNEVKLDCDKTKYSYSQGKYTLQYFPGCSGVARVTSDSGIKAVSMFVSLDLIRNFMGQYNHLLPGRINDIVFKNKTEHPFFHSGIIPDQIAALVNEIFFCQYKEPLRKIFLEGKALELFSRTMNEIITPESSTRKSVQLKTSEIEVVHHIKNVVENNLQNPPSLFKLSQEAGMSHPKLNLFFKNVFGKTIFEYLREERFKKAKLLLIEGKMNVTEVANEVGYNNLSHFAKAFRSQYGKNPGDFLKNPS